MGFFLEKIIFKSNKYYKHNTILYWDRVTLGVTKGICSNGEEAPLWYLLCNTRKNIEPPSSSISFPVSTQYLSAGHWTHSSLAFLPLWPSNCRSWSLHPVGDWLQPVGWKLPWFRPPACTWESCVFFDWPSPYLALPYVSCPQSDLQ